MTPWGHVQTASKPSVLAVNSVLRNTYMLLGSTLLFSALVAYVAMVNQVQPPGLLFTLIGMFGLMFLTSATRNSVWGLLSCFAFTGFMGYTLGPILNAFLHQFANGGELIMTSMGTTGLVFFGLSGYVLTSQKDFSYMGGFLFAASLIVFLMAIASMLFHMPMFQLFISGAIALISAGGILYKTSMIIQGGETNYIMATIALYVDIFNLFISLLRLFAAFAGERR